MAGVVADGTLGRQAYDYIRGLSRSRLAWEYLRRNEQYRRDWRTAAPGRPRPIELTTGSVLYRARRRFLGAEAWGLYCFRQP
ncbi:transcriptional regulator domain-containing protein [Govanella unica]|uniref:DUF6499 domain-containing protein n=1 Tax=Govanella unica TaxID=2975056 RepID=A0A9X3TY52_9PROT|nr:DUF6499 domain-containing protein [Govania unica]MDA5193689.1 DUF6499 domain-containing protein [Govania unica]